MELTLSMFSVRLERSIRSITLNVLHKVFVLFVSVVLNGAKAKVFERLCCVGKYVRSIANTFDGHKYNDI